MKYDNVDEIVEEIGKIIDEGYTLVDRLGEEVDSSVNDWANMRVLIGRTQSVEYDAIVCFELVCLEYRMENEKDVFWIKKYQKNHLKKLNNDVERYITCIRTWKFEDYRCREWLKRMEDILLGIKEFYACCKE